MKHHYICVDCVESKAGAPIRDIPVALFNQLRSEMAFVADVCPKCGGGNVRKILGMETSYIRGYGYADKKGTKRDMNLHTMVTGQDPYKEHRKAGESRDVITNLQRDREHRTNSKTTYL